MITSKHFYFLFATLITINTVIKLYLSYRNRRYIQKHNSQLPEKFESRITLEEHKKAADYSIEKSRFGSFTLITGLAILLIWLPGGMLNQLDLWLRSFKLSTVATGTLLFILFSLISMIIALPESIYQTFVIEEKYGFNKTTPQIFAIDLLKQIILGAILGIPLVIAILSIMIKLGTYWWAYAWAFLAIFQISLMWIYPTMIAPLFNKFTPLEDGPVKDQIVDLLNRVQFSFKGLYVMDASKRSSHGNAFFTGFGKNRRIVFFDTLLNTLEPEEATAVLAHELGHFKHKHIIKSMITGLIFSLIGFAILGKLSLMNSFYQGHFIENPSPYMALILFSVVTSIYTFILTPIGSWRSRKREYQADKFAAKYADSRKLISALIKLHKDNASTLTPDPLFSTFYYSHPPALERIIHLESLGS